MAETTRTDYDTLNISTLFDIDQVKIDSRDCLYNSDSCSTITNTTPKSIKEIMENYDNYVVRSGVSDKITLAQNEIATIRQLLIDELTRNGDNRGYSNRNDLINNINTKRDSLDAKLDSLNKGKGSLYDEYQSHYESTLMAGLMWGTLAGTVIYYVFYK